MTGDPKPIRVLFVDDDADLRQALYERLQAMNLGWRTIFVADGHTAIRHLETQDMDVIVSDLNNRHLPGEQLMGYVHRHFPKVVRIVLSSEVGRSHLHRLADSDHFYLSKPVRPEALVAAIEEAHELHRALSRKNPQLTLDDVQEILVEFFAAQIRHQKLRLSEVPIKIRPLLPQETLDSIAPFYDQPQPVASDAAEPDRNLTLGDDWLDITEPD